MIGKRRIEEICRAAGVAPVWRGLIDGRDVFIADGLSMPPHLSWRRFGIGPEQFPGGMRVTFWWTSTGDEKLSFGMPLFFELFHDPVMTPEGKQLGRINAARASAKEHLKDLRRAQAH